MNHFIKYVILLTGLTLIYICGSKTRKQKNMVEVYMKESIIQKTDSCIINEELPDSKKYLVNSDVFAIN